MKIFTNTLNKKRFSLIILTIFMITASFASGIENNIEDTDNESINFINPAIFKVELSETSTLGKIIDHGISIIERNNDYVVIFATDEEKVWLENENLNPTMLFKDYADMMDWNNNPLLLEDFHKYTELTAELEEIADSYPDITALHDLGTSVQGRTIWGLVVTDNPNIEENEPEVRICGCHHGNEIMSVELPLLLAWHMVENYDSDPRIKDLVDNRETWIIPLVNPDGREVSNRVNANGVDLNRDYGYLWGGAGGSPGPFSQPETQVIREHALDNNFVLSLSYHTTAKYINYIWNYKGEPVADNAVVVYLSNMYGEYNDYVVVEGYDWYQTRGDTNDFSYGCRGDIDWTIETENSNIPYVWNKNRDGMLDLIEASNMGLTGIVTESETGLPVYATIWVEEAYWPCFTDPKIGDYHKPLLPGTYHVIIRANGYKEQTHQVTVTDSGPTVLDIEMIRGGGRYAEQVTWVNFYDAYSYPNNFQNNPTEGVSALGPQDDECASLGVGGTIVLDMGEVGKILNGKDEDFTVYEGDGSSDGYTVSVADNWDGPWTTLGTGSGDTDFDLADKDVNSARFIKIKDDGDGSPTETNPGCDIDAVENLNPDEVFVDDDFDSSTPGWEYDHFDNIQDAIDVIAGLGTVYVFEGEYSAGSPELDLLIDKPISLITDGETKPIIDGLGNGNVLSITSDRVRVSNFIIKNSGVESFDSGIDINSDYIIISDNDIIENKIGIKVSDSSNNNKIYHNNFINNNQNALDTGIFNQWDDDYPSGGNYWDDYSGTDSDGDGIGDSSYFIPGGSSEDRYPFMKPYGYPSNPPTTPEINGNTEGEPGIEYEFTFVSTDEDDDDIFYKIDWGDGAVEDTAVFPSGVEVTASHIWEERDTYIIKAKAFDTYGYESDWGSLEITIPRYKYTTNSLIKSLLDKCPRIFLLLKLILNIQF